MSSSIGDVSSCQMMSDKTREKDILMIITSHGSLSNYAAQTNCFEIWFCFGVQSKKSVSNAKEKKARSHTRIMTNQAKE
jgi:hypothetical protein